MTVIALLEELKKFIAENTKDIIMPVRVKSNNIDFKERAAEIHIMRLPNKEAETKRIPYILLQILTGKDEQITGTFPESECNIRIVIATYAENGSEGAMYVLNLITRIRTALLKSGVIGEQFLLKKPLEYIVYPDDTAPYYMGEMMTVWEIPTIEREIEKLWLQKEMTYKLELEKAQNLS